MAKTIAEVQQAYMQTCAELGQATYKIAALEYEIEATERLIGPLKQKLKELNERAAKLQANGHGAEPTVEATSEQPQS